MIWLTSDLHFNHDKPFVWEPRGFQSVEEMNKAIIKNFNKVVDPNDTVYILGDCMLGQDHSNGINLLYQLNGIKYIAYGNHDTDTRIDRYINSKLFMDVTLGYRLKYKGITFILSHYPQLVANQGKEQPIWSIHGHTHSKDKFSDVYHAYNVNLDAHDCTPVSLDQIIEDIKEFKRESKNI